VITSTYLGVSEATKGCRHSSGQGARFVAMALQVALVACYPTTKGAAAFKHDADWSPLLYGSLDVVIVGGCGHC
jgi:hypothetical protein